MSKLYVVMAGDEPWMGSSSSYRTPHIRAFTDEVSAKRSFGQAKSQAKKWGAKMPTHLEEFFSESSAWLLPGEEFPDE